MIGLTGFLEFGYGPWVKVRIGPDARNYGDAYIWGVTCTLDGDVADPGPFSTTPLNYEVVATLRRLLHDAGIMVNWDRMKEDRPHYSMREILGPTGEKRMAKTFHQDHLKKSHLGKGQYDAKTVAADLRAVADAAEKGDVVLITRRIPPVGEASDGSGVPSQCAFLEWKFPGGAPVPSKP